jgi:hypothetical protein
LIISPSLEAIAPKYESNGDVSNQFLIFVGYSTVDYSYRLGVIVFNSPLVNLPHVSLTPGPTIGFTIFTTTPMNTKYNEYRFIRTAPDFPSLIIAGGYLYRYLSIFEISENQLVFRHNIRLPYYFRTGRHFGDLYEGNLILY